MVERSNIGKWMLKIGYLTKNGQTNGWLVVLPVGGMKPMCLDHLYNDTVAVVKSSSDAKTLKRH